MKKSTIGVIAAILVLSLGSVSALAADTSASISPGPIGPGDTAPTVYMAWRGIDIGLDVDGSGSSINPTDIRNSNYAFTGEKIYYYVLVRDDNGATDINKVTWKVDGSSQEGPCSEVKVGWNHQDAGTDPKACFCAGKIDIDPECKLDCDRPTEKIWINQATNLLFDDQTDKIYQCQLTVESGWSGVSHIQVSAKDQTGNCGSTLPESWTFNPALSISLATSDGQPLSFGTTMKDQSAPGATSPNCVMVDSEKNVQDLTKRNCDALVNLKSPEKLCDISFSTNKLVLTNTGIVDLWPYIASSNFYASNGMAKCPFSNSLSASQFEYESVQGSWNSGWREMPQYALNLGCADPTLDGQCRGGCRITQGCPIDVLSPTHSIETALKIVWPTPCIGTFDNGTVYMIVRAV